MTQTDLAAIYRDYLACLNARDWPELGRYVDDAVVHNDRDLGLRGYRAMLEADVAAIPDLRFVAEFLVVDRAVLASRLRFDCRPAGLFMGLDVRGRRVRFAENVFYRFDAGRIAKVWSVIDKAAIESQLGGGGSDARASGAAGQGEGDDPR